MKITAEQSNETFPQTDLSPRPGISKKIINQMMWRSARAVAISVNNRCPLRCRHCSVGFSGEFKGTDRKFSPEALAATIEGIDPSIYDMVAFAGGEPSLDPELLRVGITACRAKGLLSAIITAPVWAASPVAAEKFLDSVPGLDQVIMSYDQYHLDFLKIAHYEIAARAATQRGLIVVCHMCYTTDSERADLLEKLAAVKHLVGMGFARTVPVGNAAKEENKITMDKITVEQVADLGRIPRGCILGTAYVDANHSVHGCCWSNTVARSPFSVAKRPDGLAATFRQLEENPLFQSVRARGFLDALNPEGQEALVRLVNGRSFANECHICLTAMNEGNGDIWNQYIRES